MQARHADVEWLDQGELTITALAELSGLPEQELRELVELGALRPINAGAESLTFHTECIVVARRACRLRDDFDLNLEGLALALSLLERIQDLEAELRALQARMPNRSI